MAAILRYVQRYDLKDREPFMELEKKFVEMERRRDGWPRGRRSQPYAGREPNNSIICEFEFRTRAEAEDAIATMAADTEHEALFRQQAIYMKDAFSEIYDVLEL
jgi:hypothetical protein